jgi:hypothetical protein
MAWPLRARGSVVAIAIALGCPALGASCGPDLGVGSDVLWSATFESNSFSEWAAVPGRGAESFPEAGDSIVVSNDRARDGAYSVKMTIDTSVVGEQQNTLLSRVGDLPVEGYYSAWYYLPSAVTVGTYWVIFKFRLRTDASVEATTTEFYDLDLVNSSPGQMSLVLYNHLSQVHEIPLDVPHPAVPIGSWFQIESFYRNAQDNTGRITFWLDGQQIIDINGQAMAPTPWIEWEVCSIGEDVLPSPAVIYVDDCALSTTRVGPTGLIR